MHCDDYTRQQIMFHYNTFPWNKKANGISKRHFAEGQEKDNEKEEDEDK